tara:strand:- start:1497 stop:1634 length:138 start_codon:yes stop_codon:yes gene_type:complete
MYYISFFFILLLLFVYFFPFFKGEMKMMKFFFSFCENLIFLSVCL